MELKELRKIAEAEESHKHGPWAVTEDDWDGFCVYSKDGKPGIAYVAKDMQQGESEGESTARHIAAFDPPTVLALIDQIERLQGENSTLADLAKARHEWNKKNRTELKDRLEQAEQAVARVREVVANLEDHSRPRTAHKFAVAEKLRRALDGDTRE